MTGDFALRPWVIISEREARALRDYVWHEDINEDDLHRAINVVTNQLHWLSDHTSQTNSERRKLVDDATERDSADS